MKKNLLIGIAELALVVYAQSLQAQWEKMSGPEIRIINTLASCGKSLFVGTGSGLFLSAANGTD
jgi:hypothetical protein